MRLDIDVYGDVQLSREMLRFSGRNLDASPAFRAVATLLRRSEKRQFTSRGRHASGGWAKLAPATIAAKRRSKDPRVRANATRILRATDELMRSLTVKRDGAHTEVVQPHQLVFGTQVDYAKYHQKGEGVPRRRPLELRGRDRTEMVKQIQRWLMTGRVREVPE
jgi:phage gpG-like protein